MAQATLGGFEDGQTPEPQPEADETGESGPQTTISDERHDGARVDVPEAVGNYERVQPRHAGAVVKWLCPTESVTVVRVRGDGPAFEVIAAETGHASPGRHLVECEERGAAIDEAVAYMRDCRET